MTATATTCAPIQADAIWRAVEVTARWMTENLRIIDSSGALVPLRPNREQRQILYAIYVQLAAGVPVRLIILKARKVGVSTILSAFMFMMALQQSNLHAFVAAHDDESSQVLFRIAKLFQEELPKKARKGTRYSTRKQIVWKPPHRSIFDVQTAGTQNLRRGDTIHILHLSEPAFYRQAERTMLAVMNAVSDRPMTFIFEESTANGVGGQFYQDWQRAVGHRRAHPNDFSGTLPLFFSWLDHEEYRTSLPVGYELGALDEDEQELVQLGASPQQLYWRRLKIVNACGGDVELFKQEYPATPEQAFRQSGRRAIRAAITDYHRKHIRPGRRFRLHWNDDGTVRAEEGDWQGLYWEVWRPPLEGYDYTVAGDVAEGLPSDPADPRSEPDCSAGAVLNRVMFEYDAQLHGRMDPDVFGDELVKAATWYNQAWATPEINAAGLAALTPFKNRSYPYLYRRQAASDAAIPGDQSLLGWKTTTGNRDQLIDDYVAACRPDPMVGFQNKVIIHSERTVNEEETFCYNLRGKREHKSGCHDDLLFAHMIAWQLHLRCPRQYTPPFANPDCDQKRGAEIEDEAVPSYMYAGGFDNETDDEDEDG